MAGLVAITPSAGFVEPWAALIIGAAVPPVCYFAISHLKARFGYDDALDAFGCHGIGGIVGGILTGLFCVPELSWTSFGGLLYTGDPTLLVAQVLGIVVTVAIVLVLDLAIVFAVKALCGGSCVLRSLRRLWAWISPSMERAPIPLSRAWTRPAASSFGSLTGAYK